MTIAGLKCELTCHNSSRLAELSWSRKTCFGSFLQYAYVNIWLFQGFPPFTRQRKKRYYICAFILTQTYFPITLVLVNQSWDNRHYMGAWVSTKFPRNTENLQWINWSHDRVKQAKLHQTPKKTDLNRGFMGGWSCDFWPVEKCWFFKESHIMWIIRRNETNVVLNAR